MPYTPDLRASPPSRRPLLEVCVESLAEALSAVEAGAGRLEVCANMAEAGTTPSIGLIEKSVERASVPAFVMIRPRGGDFVFDDGELDVMQQDIAAAKRAGASGIVSGALTSLGTIDSEVTKRLVDAAAPLPFTFHRAIDLTPNLEYALDLLCTLGVSRILTSGGASSALVGADAIARLVRHARGTMIVVAGGSVRSDNVHELVERTGVAEVHARPTHSRPVARTAVRGVRFGSQPIPAERNELDPGEVRALANALSELR